MTKGERIKARREELGITQVALADMIGESKQTVYKYESGLVSNIPSDKVELIAKALRVQPEWIMGWDVSSSPIPPGFIPLPKTYKVPLVGRIACGTHRKQEHMHVVGMYGDGIDCHGRKCCTCLLVVVWKQKRRVVEVIFKRRVPYTFSPTVKFCSNLLFCHSYPSFDIS